MLDKVTDDYNTVASEDSISNRARNWFICCSTACISTVVLAKSGTWLSIAFVKESCALRSDWGTNIPYQWIGSAERNFLETGLGWFWTGVLSVSAWSDVSELAASAGRVFSASRCSPRTGEVALVSLFPSSGVWLGVVFLTENVYSESGSAVISASSCGSFADCSVSRSDWIDLSISAG